jgi:hypothetical protein
MEYIIRGVIAPRRHHHRPGLTTLRVLVGVDIVAFSDG